MADDTIRYHSVSHWEPLIKLRALFVWWNREKDEVHTEDVPVVGCTSHVKEWWERNRAGKLVCVDTEVQHGVLLWDTESSAPHYSDEDPFGHECIVIGPATMLSNWWDARVVEKVAAQKLAFERSERARAAKARPAS